MARRIRLALYLIVAAGLVFLLVKLPGFGQLAVDISAKWACQCRFIDGGSDAFCVAEDPVGFGPMNFDFTPADHAVTTSIWGLVDATGRYVPESGCRVE